MYSLYVDGEETVGELGLEEMREVIAELREDFIKDELRDRKTYSDWYEPTGTPEEMWVDYFRDVYQVVQLLDPELFL